MAKNDQLSDVEHDVQPNEETKQTQTNETIKDAEKTTVLSAKNKTAKSDSNDQPETEANEAEKPSGPVTFAMIKEQSAKLKTKPHHMKLKKNEIVLYRGKDEGHPSDIHIAYKNILQLRFSPGETLRSGFLTFSTKDAATRKVYTLPDAVHSRHAVLFSKKHNDAFRAFAKALERFMKGINPKFEGLVMLGKEEGYEAHAKEQELKKKLTQYKKDGVIYCPMCYTTAYTQVHPAQKKGKLKHEDELLRCKNCGHKWHVKPVKAKKETPVETPTTDTEQTEE